MKKVILTTAFLLSILSVQAQEFFSDKRPVQSANEFTKKVNDISYDIDLIIKNNKEKLKQDLNEIDLKVENNELTKAEADKLRNEKAEFYAKQIEEETKIQEDKIKVLINNKIEDNINFSSDMTAYQKQLIENKSLFVVEYRFGNSSLIIDDSVYKDYYESGFVSSAGVGLGAKTRIGKETSQIYWKSMLDVNFHLFKIKDNKTFESVNNETVLDDVDFPVTKSRMNFTELNWSNYLEYDFSKRKYDEFGNQIIKSRQSFFAGLGGFLGYSQLSRQLEYEIDGEKYRQTTAAKFNSNQFIYGVGAYIGYQNFSLRATYNLNQVFKRSFADQNIFNMSVVIELL
ncbi:hypothetical protein MG290_08005 [Flavobacterium sp. CBA20B-1]|uniref:hypothetical protein n=1 Tax=unclassified Flavobacterium TaxID=196869 RepID=UPI0022241385|nr:MULTISPECIES: hypothetical protein [unclassified Flavobacterium]WCM40909.1 hypothetical protein MG290_08005 [Flavobacterium sp. CBA20B-1]